MTLTNKIEAAFFSTKRSALYQPYWTNLYLPNYYQPSVNSTISSVQRKKERFFSKVSFSYLTYLAFFLKNKNGDEQPQSLGTNFFMKKVG